MVFEKIVYTAFFFLVLLALGVYPLLFICKVELGTGPLQ